MLASLFVHAVTIHINICNQTVIFVHRAVYTQRDDFCISVSLHGFLFVKGIFVLRLLDLIKRKALKLNNIETLILDEADEMLNMGFLEDIEAIISRVPEERQTLLFSATMPDAIKRIGVQFMKDPEHVKIKAKELTNVNVDQYFIRVKEQEKFDTMTRLMDVDQPDCQSSLDVPNVVWTS